MGRVHTFLQPFLHKLYTHSKRWLKVLKKHAWQCRPGEGEQLLCLQQTVPTGVSPQQMGKGNKKNPFTLKREAGICPVNRTTKAGMVRAPKGHILKTQEHRVYLRLKFTFKKTLLKYSRFIGLAKKFVWVFCKMSWKIWTNFLAIPIQGCVAFCCITKSISYTYTYQFFSRLFSHIGHYGGLSIVPCAMQ